MINWLREETHNQKVVSSNLPAPNTLTSGGIKFH